VRYLLFYGESHKEPYRAIKSQKEPKVRLNIEEAKNQIPGKPAALTLLLARWQPLSFWLWALTDSQW
jgi:hypothetical protein